jgi:nucleotide-binding universal stress UspA family protein
MKLILHPTDFSYPSLSALDLACALAHHQNARLMVVHVVMLPPPPPQPYTEAGLASRGDIDRGELEARLEQIRADHAAIEIDSVLVEGKPAQEILRLAKETDCDAIVLGTHGRTGLHRLLMGSVAEHVVREAPCPVITVKRPVALGEGTQPSAVGSASRS